MDKANNEKRGIRPGIILAVVAVVGVLVGGKMLGWFGSSGRETARAPADPTTETTEPVVSRSGSITVTPKGTGPESAVPVAGRAPGVGTTPGGGIAMAPRTPVTPTTPTPGGDAATPGGAEAMADWSLKLDDILGSDADEAKKADQLLAIWKTLPEEGQIETMQHISNLLTDDKFPVLGQILTNAAMPEAVLDIIMTDALNRPNAMKLPALLDVAKTPDHPKAEEAREILEVFVDENHGTDWAKWDAAVQKWLKENPDELDPGK